LIRLLFLDADGTLVGRDGVHPRAWAALERARDAGIALALCTGRPGVGSSEELARRVEPRGLHVFQTGAVISAAGERAVRTRPLPRETLLALVALSRAIDYPLEAYGERSFYLERMTDLHRRHADVLEMEPTIADLAAIDEPIVRAQWVVAESEWPRFRALTEPLPGLGIHTGSGPWAPGTLFANLIRSDTSKVDALLWLAGRHGLTREEVAMVGDGPNDVDAMAEAGLGIAMANAPDFVRAGADFVAGDVEAGGVADAIDFVLADPTTR